MSDDRATLSVKKSKSYDQKRAELAEMDVQELALNDRFLRFLFTVLSSAGMFSGNYQPDGRNHAFAEGRRSLGLDILRSVEGHLGRDALLRILEAEKKNPIGGSYDHRRTSDDGDEHDGNPGPVVGPVYLDYGTKPAA